MPRGKESSFALFPDHYHSEMPRLNQPPFEEAYRLRGLSPGPREGAAKIQGRLPAPWTKTREYQPTIRSTSFVASWLATAFFRRHPLPSPVHSGWSKRYPSFLGLLRSCRVEVSSEGDQALLHGLEAKTQPVSRVLLSRRLLQTQRQNSLQTRTLPRNGLGCCLFSLRPRSPVNTAHQST